jgi:hypothetical protein
MRQIQTEGTRWHKEVSADLRGVFCEHPDLRHEPGVGLRREQGQQQADLRSRSST